MSTIGDLAKLLEQVPIWKRLTALPARIEALEAKVATLEAKLGAGPAAALGACTLCGGGLKVTAEQPDTHFGVFGVKRLDVACTSCGATSTRQYDPRKP